jgi:hypothetical protein
MLFGFPVLLFYIALFRKRKPLFRIYEKEIFSLKNEDYWKEKGYYWDPLQKKWEIKELKPKYKVPKY